MSTNDTTKGNVILVPVDFSATSDNALGHALAIAGQFDNEVVIMHVVSETLMGNLFLTGVDKSMISAGVEKKMESLIKRVHDKYPEIKIKTLVKEGKVYKNIIKTGKKLNCDSIVMGFNGLSGEEDFMGSTTSRVLKNATLPIIIIKKDTEVKEFKKIVLPIDLELESRQKVSWAIHIAKKYNSEVHVIMEVEQDSFLKNKVDAAMNQVSSILKKNNVKHVCKVLNDEEYPDAFGKDIIQYCEEVSADMVMILTQKEKNIKNLFLGSFAERIIKKVKVPVMAINPKETGIKAIAGY